MYINSGQGKACSDPFAERYSGDEFLLSISHLRRLESAEAGALLLTAYMHCMELDCGALAATAGAAAE